MRQNYLPLPTFWKQNIIFFIIIKTGSKEGKDALGETSVHRERCRVGEAVAARGEGIQGNSRWGYSVCSFNTVWGVGRSCLCQEAKSNLLCSDTGENCMCPGNPQHPHHWCVMPSLINYQQFRSSPDLRHRVPGYTRNFRKHWWPRALAQARGLVHRWNFLCEMRSRGSFHTIITIIVIMTYRNEGIQVGPIPMGRPKRQEKGEKGEKGRRDASPALFKKHS